MLCLRHTWKQIRSSCRGQALSRARERGFDKAIHLLLETKTDPFKYFSSSECLWWCNYVHFFVFTFCRNVLVRCTGRWIFLEQCVNIVVNCTFSSCAISCDGNFRDATKHVIIKLKKWFFTAGFLSLAEVRLNFTSKDPNDCSKYSYTYSMCLSM